MPDTLDTSAGQDRYRAPALDKGLDILELLAGESSGLTRAEIVRAMGRSPSEIYRMLERLVARGYVTRSLEGDRHALSMKLFLMVNAHPPVRRLTAQAQPLMDIFARTALQSVHLVVPENNGAVVVAQASPPSNWEFRLRVGAQLNLLTTGSGQTLLAFQDPARRAEMLANLPIDPAQIDPTLWGRLDHIRTTGYRLAPSLQLVGVQDMSVPLRGPDGYAFAVLTCPFVEHVGLFRDQALDIETCLAQLQELAETLALD
jgi:DNA-binding IclR family transcriptional regulator